MSNYLELPHPISSNRYWRHFGNRIARSPEAISFIDLVRLKAKIAKVAAIEGNVAIDLIYHPRRTAKGLASKTRLDLDNCQKVVLDALNGVAYTDDKQITRIYAEIGQPLPNGGVTVAWAKVK